MPALLTKHLSTNHRNLRKDGTVQEDGTDGGGNDGEEEVELPDEALEDE